MKNKNTILSFGIATILVSLFFFIFLYEKSSNTENFILSPIDEEISWKTGKLVGINEDNKIANIDDLKDRMYNSYDNSEKYELSISIANEYKYLGDGKLAFKYLNNAIEIDPKRSLAYMNMGALLSELGATTSARIVYEKGLSKEPQLSQNHIALLDFYTHTDGILEKDIEKTFIESLEYTKNNKNIMKMYAKWSEDIGNIGKAIELWEGVLSKNPDNKREVEEHINILKKNAI